jgi:molybdopterin molybdotransferase
MISVTEAKSLIQAASHALPPVRMALQAAHGHVLAENVYSSIDMPPFPQSAMDGYAIQWGDQGARLIVGEVAAGVHPTFTLLPGQCARIFTGAPVPNGADTVIQRELVRVEGDYLILETEQLKQGANIRLLGAEIKTGQLALEQGVLLNPGGIGFLAGLGIETVAVYPQPKCAIIVTGNELQSAGQPLEYGQVYESNSITLLAVLHKMGISDIAIYRATDVLEDVVAQIQNALASSDLILLTGGISVGDYDFVLEATQICGVTQIFHKVKQKPGKPLFFGSKDDKLVFGLPGNPASVLTCFYEYVVLAVQGLTQQLPLYPVFTAAISAAYTKPKGLTHFLKGWFDGQKVVPLGAQESFKLSSFARSNCLIVIGEDELGAEEGALVEVHLL